MFRGDVHIGGFFISYNSHIFVPTEHLLLKEKKIKNPEQSPD